MLNPVQPSWNLGADETTGGEMDMSEALQRHKEWLANFRRDIETVNGSSGGLFDVSDSDRPLPIESRIGITLQQSSV